jgi:hypothetical protein
MWGAGLNKGPLQEEPVYHEGVLVALDEGYGAVAHGLHGCEACSAGDADQLAVGRAAVAGEHQELGVWRFPQRRRWLWRGGRRDVRWFGIR